MFPRIPKIEIVEIFKFLIRLLRKTIKVVFVGVIYIFVLILRFVFGIESISTLLLVLPTPFIKPVLRSCGCKIGQRVVIQSPLVIMNADSGDYSNLVIGDRCWIGKLVCFDLAEPIEIGDNTALSLRVTILTHSDPGGANELRKHYPPKTGRVIISSNCWIGVASIILSGVTVGDHSVIGASSLVREDVTPYSVIAGSPAKVIRTIELNSKY